MKVKIGSSGTMLFFDFELEDDDLKEYVANKGRVRFRKNRCYLKLPPDIRLDEIHPDILALSATLLVFLHIGKSLKLPFPVSREFAALFHERTGKTVSPSSDSVRPRRPPADSVPALAYSGGADSTAALALMPENTVLVFLDRPQSSRPFKTYSKEAAFYACSELKAMGRSVFLIETNLEYMRKPMGFPIDVAVALPVLLLADHLAIDSVAFGTVMESAYRVGHMKYENYVDRKHYLRWGGLFGACGVPFNLVTAGISEVGTSYIAERSEFARLSHSCTKGGVHAPCHNCWKCFRKNLLKSVLEKRELDPDEIDAMFSARDARKFLPQEPIQHENVIAYSIERCNTEHELIEKFKARLDGSWSTTAWMKKWYPRSREVIVEKYRKSVEESILSFLEPMTEEEQREVESMDREAYLRSTGRVAATQDFNESLRRFQPRKKVGLYARVASWLSGGARRP